MHLNDILTMRASNTSPSLSDDFASNALATAVARSTSNRLFKLAVADVGQWPSCPHVQQ